MKVALQLSGHMRYYEKTYPELKKYIIDPLQPDIFIYSWKNRGLQKRDTDYQIDTEEPVSEDHVNHLYNPKVVRFLDDEEDPFKVKTSAFKKKYKQLHKVPVENIISMYYLIMFCNQLRLLYQQSENITYDLVIRCRPDLVFESGIPGEEIESVANTIYVPDTGNQQINDHFAFSNPKAMDYYTDLISKVNEYHDPEAPSPPKTTQRGCAIHAETLLNFHLRKSEYDIKETKTKYFLPHKHKDKINKYQML